MLESQKDAQELIRAITDDVKPLRGKDAALVLMTSSAPRPCAWGQAATATASRILMGPSALSEVDGRMLPELLLCTHRSAPSCCKSTLKRLRRCTKAAVMQQGGRGSNGAGVVAAGGVKPAC